MSNGNVEQSTADCSVCGPNSPAKYRPSRDSWECRRVNLEYKARRRDENRSFALALLGGRCARCGDSESLQFDHIDWRTKDKEIAPMLCGSRAALLAELSKCQLLCYPCHRAKSNAEATLRAELKRSA